MFRDFFVLWGIAYISSYLLLEWMTRPKKVYSLFFNPAIGLEITRPDRRSIKNYKRWLTVIFVIKWLLRLTNNTNILSWLRKLLIVSSVWGLYYSKRKKLASVDVGLMFMVFNLRQLVNITCKKGYKKPILVNTSYNVNNIAA